MARRPVAKPVRGGSKSGSLRPIPVYSPVPSAISSAVQSAVLSTMTTPSSSAYPSAYPSEDEGENDGGHFVVHHFRGSGSPELAFAKLSIAPTTASSSEKSAEAAAAPVASVVGKRKGKDKVVVDHPFPLMELPPELRLKVYEYYFDSSIEHPSTADCTGFRSRDAIDLDPDNKERIFRKLVPLLRTCRKVNAEASSLFFGLYTFRLFPTHPYGKIARTRKPLLARMKPHQRACLHTLELRVGPNFTKPPASWVVNPKLGLRDCEGVRRVRVFVTFDPGHPDFRWVRKPEGFYEKFCAGLLDQVIKGLPLRKYDDGGHAANKLEVEFDAVRSIKMSGELMQRLLATALSHDVRVTFGPERGWKSVHDKDEVVVAPDNSPLPPLEADGAGIVQVPVGLALPMMTMAGVGNVPVAVAVS